MADALEDARANIEPYRPVVERDIDLHIAALERLSTNRQPSNESASAIYSESAAIIENAGLFDMEDVGRAAYSLCDVVDILGHQGRWDATSVAVHVEAIRLLRFSRPPAAERAALLGGLDAVLQKIREGACDEPTRSAAL